MGDGEWRQTHAVCRLTFISHSVIYAKVMDLTENLNMKVFLALTLTVLFAGNFHCAPVSDDTQLSLFHVIASEDAFLEDELLDGFKSAATRQKRGAAEDMFALINGIFGRADRDGNHQLEIEEYWSTFKAFDLNEDGAITRNEYIGFMTSGRFPAMRMMVTSVKWSVSHVKCLTTVTWTGTVSWTGRMQR